MSKEYGVTYEEARLLLALMQAPGFDLLWLKLIAPRLESERHVLENGVEMTPQQLGRSQGAIRILRDIPVALDQFRAEMLRFVEDVEKRKSEKKGQEA